MDGKEMNLIDILSLFNFTMSLKNYGENVDQSKMNESIVSIVKDIHNHLSEQDKTLLEIKALIGRSLNDETHKEVV